MTTVFNTGTPKNLDKKRSKRAKELRLAREKMLSEYKTRFDDDKFFRPLKSKSNVYIRETVQYPSLNTNVGSTELPDKKEYTGTKLVGIATMHKSNMVPVFSKDEAEQISKMRRN